MTRWLWAALALLLLLPSAAAQTAKSSLSFDGLADQYLARGDTHVVSFQTVLTATDMVCREAVIVPTQLQAILAAAPATEDPNQSRAAQVAPSMVNFSIPQGAYGSNPALPAARPYRGSQAATIVVSAKNLTNATRLTIEIQAASQRLPSTPDSGCGASGGVPAAQAAKTIHVDFAPNVPPPAPETPRLPVPPGLAILGLLGALLIRRRQQQA